MYRKSCSRVFNAIELPTCALLLLEFVLLVQVVLNLDLVPLHLVEELPVLGLPVPDLLLDHALQGRLVPLHLALDALAEALENLPHSVLDLGRPLPALLLALLGCYSVV